MTKREFLKRLETVIEDVYGIKEEFETMEDTFLNSVEALCDIVDDIGSDCNAIKNEVLRDEWDERGCEVDEIAEALNDLKDTIANTLEEIMDRLEGLKNA